MQIAYRLHKLEDCIKDIHNMFTTYHLHTDNIQITHKLHKNYVHKSPLLLCSYKMVPVVPTGKTGNLLRKEVIGMPKDLETAFSLVYSSRRQAPPRKPNRSPHHEGACPALSK
jgi:hypothetical protein